MVRTFLRAFGAFVTLLALLVGLPAVLGYGTWAIVLHARPRQASLSQLLTTPDNGNLFLWALVVVGWIAWLAFAVSVLVEIPAQLRGRVARRLPALGWSQRLAGGLVGAILALMPMAGGALAATGAPAPRLAVTAPQTPDFAAAPAALETVPEATPVHAGPHAHHPHYVVRATRPAETLWGIAESTLGSGERWREIAALNDGRVMDHQHRVFDAERPLQPGWQLLLPHDARVAPVPASVPASSPSAAAHASPHASAHAAGAGTAVAGSVGRRDREVTVRPGDTLSAIAEREMGSADAWPRLFAANRGVVAPDGARLTDPDVIEPGMRLTIPAADADSDGGTRGGAVPPGSPASHPGAGAGAGSGAGASSAAGAGSSSAPSTAPSTAPSPSGGVFTHGSGAAGGTAQATPTPVQTPTPTPLPASASAAGHGGHQSGSQFAVAAGTSVLGAVLLGTVALRRSRRRTVTPRQTPQHRSSGRPPKPPTPGMPPLEPAAVPLPPVPAPPARGPYVPTLADPYADPRSGPYPDAEFGGTFGGTFGGEFAGQSVPPVEQQSSRDLDLLGRALRSMARNVAREGRRLPPINVVRVTAAHTVELHLVAPSPPVAPFRAAHASTVWWCTPDAPGLLGPEAAAVVPSPYPALVSLGETVDGATVLVDLEAIRLLHVSGEPHDIARVMRTLALELTFTPLADRVGVHVVGVSQELAAVADDRLVVHPDLEHAVAALQRRDAAVRSALVQAGAATPREARSRGLGGDEWAPEVVLCASYPTGDTPEALGRLLDARPRGSVAVITAAPPQGTGPVARWTLPASGHGVVPGLEMDIQLQKLDDDTYHQWLRLLGADLVPPTVTAAAPPPSWPPTGPIGEPPASPRFPEPVGYGPAPTSAPSPTSAVPATGENSPVSRRFLEPGAPLPTGATPGSGETSGQGSPAPSPVASRFPAPGTPVVPDPRFSGPVTAPVEASPSGAVVPLTGRFPAPGTGAPPALRGGEPADPGAARPGAGTGDPVSPGRFPPPGTPLRPVCPTPAPYPPTATPENTGSRPGWTPGLAAPGSAEVAPLRGRFPVPSSTPSRPATPHTPGHAGPQPAPARADTAPGAAISRFPAPGYPAPQAPSANPVAAGPPRADLAGGAPGAISRFPAPGYPAPQAPSANPVAAGQPGADLAGSAAGGAISRFPSVGYPAVPPAAAYGAAAPQDAAGRAGAVQPAVPVRGSSWQATPPGGYGASPELVPADAGGNSAPPSDPWILALLASPPAGAVPGESKLRVLGPVELAGATGPVEPEWRAGLVEVAARRALGPAQGAYVSADAIGRLREWLGDGPDGRPVNLSCDWEDFQSLRARGLGDGGNAGDAALARALALVRGAPFAEVTYPWAEQLRARMTAAVVDVAHELTLRRLRAGDHRGAEAAAHRGLVAEPDAELLLRDLVLLHADAGEGPQLQRTVARLETKAARTGLALEPETAALIDELRSPAIDPLARR